MLGYKGSVKQFFKVKVMYIIVIDYSIIKLAMIDVFVKQMFFFGYF